MKALVTGATGFLGGHLVQLLEEHGYSIIALGRDELKGAMLNSQHTTFKSVDITDRGALAEAFETVDVVFHCAALSSVWGDAQDFQRVNVQASRYVLECCEKFLVKRLVYVSSTSVYFDFTDRILLSEDQVLEQGFANEYAKSKYQAEQLLLAERKSTDVVIIRPRGIIGDGDTSIMPRILRVANKGFFPLFNRGQAMVDVTYVKNVAHALYLAGKQPNIDGQCYNISNLEPVTVKALLERVLDKRKNRVIFIPVAYPLMYGLAWLFEATAKLLSLAEPSITCYGIGLLAKTQTLDVSAAQQQLGYEPLYSLDYAIEKYLAWERDGA